MPIGSVSAGCADLQLTTTVNRQTLVAHFLVFSLITALLSFGSRQRFPVTIVMTVALIGGLDGIHQSTRPGPEAGVWDFLTDAAAAALTTDLLHRFGRSPPVYTDISRH